MTVLNFTEVLKWLEQHSLEHADNHIKSDYYRKTNDFRIPADSGRKTAIAKEISNLFSNDCLLWINEYGIWPSSENIELFDGYRRSININYPLYEK